MHDARIVADYQVAECKVNSLTPKTGGLYPVRIQRDLIQKLPPKDFLFWSPKYNNAAPVCIIEMFRQFTETIDGPAILNFIGSYMKTDDGTITFYINVLILGSDLLFFIIRDMDRFRQIGDVRSDIADNVDIPLALMLTGL